MATRTLEQQRAQYALEVIQRHAQREGDSKFQKRYATLVHGVPGMVLQNGLGQALAYLLADAEGKDAAVKPARALYDELQEWLCGAPSDRRPERVYANSDLLAALVAGSRADYQRAQQTTLALMGWMRKLADAYLPEVER